ncbi:MAG: SseB family protein [Lachnospiraceae bacterium]|nr:SseB family protein [Lachnospiraceae bacterium]
MAKSKSNKSMGPMGMGAPKRVAPKAVPPQRMPQGMGVPKHVAPGSGNGPMLLKNEELNQKLVSYREDKDPEKLKDLLGTIVKSNFLMLAVLNDQKVPIPLAVNGADGKKILALYTDMQQIDKERINNVPTNAIILQTAFIFANKFVMDSKGEITGIVINPFTSTVFLPENLIQDLSKNIKVERIISVENEVNQKIPETATDAEVNLLERRRFDDVVLPDLLFGKGEEFMEQLVTKKEEYVDQLFEQAYQDIRRYPFLPEDYKVMAIDPSADETFVSIEMPEEGRSVGVNSQIFIIWNKETKKGRFFGTKMDQGNKSILMEALPDHKLRVVSPAPESGTEMNTILTLVRGE